jgi:hypothetical protein
LFGTFEIWLFEIVSNFEFSASDFENPRLRIILWLAQGKSYV